MACECDRGGERVLMTGATGLVGSRLACGLAEDGYVVTTLVRREVRPGRNEVRWDPQQGELEAAALDGCGVVVHLAGENIAAGRWTPDRKRVILRSRMDGTSLLSRTLAGLRRRPRVLVSASAVGFYGDCGEAVVDEDSPPGKGFLAEVARQWESATEPARQAGIRVVNLRMGMVLSAAGGALARMLGPFKAGLGGVVGGGRQYISWIAMDDLLAAIRFVMSSSSLSGPVNAVSPQAVTNRQFVTTLGRVLGRPTRVPLPAIAVRLMFGEMGRSLLLEGARVRPTRLIECDFAFRYGDLEAALRHELEPSETADRR